MDEDEDDGQTLHGRQQQQQQQQASHFLSRGAGDAGWEALHSRLRHRERAAEDDDGDADAVGEEQGQDDGVGAATGEGGGLGTEAPGSIRRNSDVSLNERLEQSPSRAGPSRPASPSKYDLMGHSARDYASARSVELSAPNGSSRVQFVNERSSSKGRGVEKQGRELTRTLTEYEDELDRASPTLRERLRKRVRKSTRPSVDVQSDLEAPMTRRKPQKPRTKLGTFEGVFLPVVLNVQSVIMFLRFGFVVAQTGLYGALSLTVLAYAVDLLTVLSVSAIATNGTVRGGGLYYLISRTLGPEFGGSIGLVYYLGLVLNSGMNVVAFVESLTSSFGVEGGGPLPLGWSWEFLYGSAMLLFCTICCLVGSKAFGKLTMAFAVVAFISNVSIPLSSLIKRPFRHGGTDGVPVTYTSWSIATFRENLLPHFTAHSPGSGVHEGYGKRENWQTVFGVLYPAVAGVLAGTSLSGDLKTPSRSIPKGTLQGLAFTGCVYAFVLVLLAGTVTRTSLEKDLNILKDISIHPYFIIAGVLGSSIFSTLVGIIGAAKMLQAIARDNLLPSLLPFAQGSGAGDDPIFAIGLTWAITQLVLFSDNINDIASLVSMTTLLAFGVINLACFLLRLGAAPNFRPSFHYFSTLTAGIGVVLCLAAMFFVDVLVAALSLILMAMLFTIIHYLSPPKLWGDVTQGLIYHQVRKYLLRLDSRKEHVKFWRPQILMLVNGPPRTKGVYRMPEAELNLVHLCNALKKGSLYVLGYTVISNFRQAVPELRRLQSAWLKFVETTKIKAFINITVANDERTGARNLVLGSGLGGMRPNIVVLGFQDFGLSQRQQPTRRASHASSILSTGSDSTIRASPNALPPPGFDICRYVGMIEDILALNKSLAIGVGMGNLQLLTKEKVKGRRYIDLWPIRMSVPEKSTHAAEKNSESHAFDSYTMILQMGTVLHMVEGFEDYTLRCMVFVEHASEIEEEMERIRYLLDNLRIPAELRVHRLDALATYQYIIHGQGDVNTRTNVDHALRLDPWWQALSNIRNPTTTTQTAALGVKQARNGRPSRSKSPNDYTSKSLPSSHRTAMRLRLGGLHVHRLSSPATSDGERNSSSTSDEEEDDSDSDEEDGQRVGSWRRAKSFSAHERSSLLSKGRLEEERSRRYGTSVESMTSTPKARPKSSLGPFRSPSRTSVVPEDLGCISLLDVDLDQGGHPRQASFAPSPTTSILNSDGTVNVCPTFDDLPTIAQHLIINEMFRTHSLLPETRLVLTTLPAPDSGTSEYELSSQRYLQGIQVLCRDVPPVLLVHAKVLSVTMTL